jgi:hypothetical protein
MGNRPHKNRALYQTYGAVFVLKIIQKRYIDHEKIYGNIVSCPVARAPAFGV